MSKKLFISNAFSFNMIPSMECLDMEVDAISTSKVKEVISEFEKSDVVVSMSGQATCDLFKSLTGETVEFVSNKIEVRDGDKMLVMQYNGPRLDVGANEVPRNGSCRFLMVHFIEVEKA